MFSVYSEGYISKRKSGISNEFRSTEVFMLGPRGRQHDLFLTEPSREWSASMNKYVSKSSFMLIVLYFCLHFEQEKNHLPPPSFCYILTAHPNLAQIDIIEEDPISKLYQPPVPRFLKEILQVASLFLPRSQLVCCVCALRETLLTVFNAFPDWWPLYPLQFLCQSDLPKTTGNQSPLSC